MSNSPITQVEPQSTAMNNLITQVPPEGDRADVRRSSERSTQISTTKPDSVKSPRSPLSTKSRRGGFLGLFLCCTFGADSLLDDTDRPKSESMKLVQIKKQQQQQQQSQQQQQLQQQQHQIAIDERSNSTVTANINGNNSSAGNASEVVTSEPTLATVSGPSSTPGTPDIEPIKLLGPISPENAGRKCLVLDLDETLVHSSFKIIHQADYIVPVEIENQTHNVYVIKRPGVDEFLKRMGDLYEVVVFTASLSKYADPVLDQLDIHKVVKHRLFRESCYNHKGNYVKDLSQIGRDLTQSIIIDNSPASYIFHVNNAIPISSWFNDPHDTELLDLIPFLHDLTAVPDVTMVLDTSNIPSEILENV